MISVDDLGYYNLMIAIVDRARDDFVDGYKLLINLIGRIPDETEYQYWLKQNKRATDTQIRAKIRNFYSSIGFVIHDPYSLFDDRTLSILSNWKNCALKEV